MRGDPHDVSRKPARPTIAGSDFSAYSGFLFRNDNQRRWGSPRTAARAADDPYRMDFSSAWGTACTLAPGGSPGAFLFGGPPVQTECFLPIPRIVIDAAVQLGPDSGHPLCVS
jgi:hypothetical protein